MPDRGPLDQVPAIYHLLIIICMQRTIPQSVVLHAVHRHMASVGGAVQALPRHDEREWLPYGGCLEIGACCMHELRS